MNENAVKLFNFFSGNYGISAANKAKKRTSAATVPAAPEKNVKIPYYSYMANSKITFGKTPDEELPEFDAACLKGSKLDDEFDLDEGVSFKDPIYISDLDFLAGPYIAEQIRHIENTGEIIPYKERNIREENKSCSEEEIQAKIEEEKQNFLKRFEEEKQSAIAQMDKVNPTKRPHIVYRIINNLYTPDAEPYFEKIHGLKQGEEIVLSSVPLFVGTDPEVLFNAYSRSAKDGVLFKINLPEGSKLVKYPSGDGISQLLMKPDAKFKTVDNKLFKDNFRLIGLEYINEE